MMDPRPQGEPPDSHPRPSDPSPPLSFQPNRDHSSAHLALLLDRFNSRVTNLTLRLEDVEKDMAEVRGLVEQQEHVSRLALGYGARLTFCILHTAIGMRGCHDNVHHPEN